MLLYTYKFIILTKKIYDVRLMRDNDEIFMRYSCCLFYIYLPGFLWVAVRSENLEK